MTPTAASQTVTIRLDSDTSAVTATLPALQTDARVIITDDATFAQVAGVANTAKERIRELRELPMFYGTKDDPGSIVLAHSAHAKLMEQFNAVHTKLKAVVDTCEAAMKKFRLEQKAAADHARRIADEAIRKANEETARAAAQAEADKLAEAEKLRKEGRMREAREIAAEPVPVAVPMPAVQVVAQAAPRVAGLTEKFPFEGKVVDIMETIRAIAAGTIPLSYLNAKGEMKDLLEINQPLLNFLAKQRQADLGIAGCTSIETVSFARSRS